MEENGDRENKVHDYQMEGDIKENPFNELEPRSDQGLEQEVGTSPVPMNMDQRTKDTKAEENDSSDLDRKNISESTTTSLETPASETRTLKSSNSLNISQSGVRPKSFKTKLHRKIFNVQSVKKELLKKFKKNRKEEMKRKEELIDLEMEAEIKKMKREREDAKARTKQLKKQAQLSDVQREGKELIDKLVENRQLEKKKQNEEIELANEAVIEKGEREREDANASQIRQNKEAQKQSLWEKAVAETNKGHEYLKGGKYDQAILFYKNANKICPAANKKELSTSRLDFVAATLDEKLKNEEIIIEECTATLKLNEKDTKVLERLSLAAKHYRQMRKALEDVTWLCVLDGFSNDRSRVNASRIIKETKKHLSTLEIVDRILKKFGPNKIDLDNKARKSDDLRFKDLKDQFQGTDLMDKQRKEQMKPFTTIGGYPRYRAIDEEMNEDRIEWKKRVDHQRQKDTSLRKHKEKLEEYDKQCQNMIGQHEEENTRMRMIKDDKAFEAEMNEHRIKYKERVDHQRQKDTVLRKDEEKSEEYDGQCENIKGRSEEENTSMRMIQGDQEARKSFDLSFKDLKDQAQGTDLMDEQRKEQMKTLTTIGGYARSRVFVAGMNEQRIKWKERVDQQRQKDTVLRKDKEKPEEYAEQCHNIIGQHEEDNTRIRMIEGDQAPPLFVVAIDFGTTYSGWACSSRNDFLKDPSIVYGYHWNNGGNIMLKTNTCILFDKEGSQTGKYDSCGYDAYDKYVNLCADKKHNDYYFFSCYKMILYENMNISSQSMIKTVDGKEMRALTVFSETIRFFVEHFNSKNAKLYEDVRPNEIQWVLTVPAIWNEKAKTFMREAAIAAGLESARLNIALEPDAAALYCKSLSFQTDNSIFSVFQPNTKYMVVDIGGGTYDITVNKVTPEGLEELHMANGRNNGGTTINKAFWDLLTIVYGKDTITDFRINNHDDELRLEQDFEIRKTSIALSDKREHMYLPIPAALHNIFMKRKTMTEMDQQCWKSICGEKVEVDLKRGKLKISIKLLENLFKDSFIQIYKRISELLAKPELSDLTTILVVGGFSDSPLLYGKLKEHLKIDHKKVHILKPKEAASAVMKGAVYFGHLL